MEPMPPAKAPMSGPKSSAVMYTMVSPILKKPSVVGTYMEKTMVAAVTRDVKTAAIAIWMVVVGDVLLVKADR